MQQFRLLELTRFFSEAWARLLAFALFDRELRVWQRLSAPTLVSLGHRHRSITTIRESFYADLRTFPSTVIIIFGFHLHFPSLLITTNIFRLRTGTDGADNAHEGYGHNCAETPHIC